MADSLDLAAAFEPQDEASWRTTAEASLKGKPLAKLTRRTEDGIEVPPLFTADDDLGPDAAGLPGQAPFTRGATAASPHPGGWQIRARYAEATPEALNAAVLQDLERGVNRADLDARAIDGLEDLSAALAEVDEALAPVTLEAGVDWAGAAATMLALWSARGRDPKVLSGSLACDPLGAWARDGQVHGRLQTNLRWLGQLGAHTAEAWPGVRVAQVDTAPYHEAGAPEATELGLGLAAAVAYLRAFADAGVPAATGARLVEFRVPLDARVFPGLAKVRALRRLWSHALAACGVPAESRGATVHASTSRRGLTARDPWVNMLRTTAVCFAGATAGADSVEVAPYDEALGAPSKLGRRVARNTQIVLQEESHLGAVRDPAGGAWYVERLTDDLAARAWALFQEVESQGGLQRALESGWLHARLDEAWAARARDLAKRKRPITGVSEFPNLDEPTVEPSAAPAAPAAPGEAPALSSWAEAVAAAADGTGLRAIAQGLLPGAGQTVTPLPRRRDAAAFEALRDRSDTARAASGHRPKVLLVNLGPLAEHTARATWARNFFAVAGIEAVDVGEIASPEAATEALTSSGAAIAVLCGTDARYADDVARFAPALRGAGVKRLFLAGHPGDHRDAYTEAGVQGFVHVGCDVLGILESVWTELGASR